MEKTKIDTEKRIVSERTSSLVAPDLESAVRRIGWCLHKLHELVMTRVLAEGDVELGEEINDELKPIVDQLLHFEVRRGP